MGLFSRKTDDTKARIEELKKKIQAEQQAYSSATREQQTAPAHLPPPAQPPPVTHSIPAPEPALTQEIVVEERAPVESVAPRVVAAPVHRAPEPRVRETLSFDPPMSQTQQSMRPRSEPLGDAQGVVLDLGEGMSLNVPVRTRMHLDEFLGVADKVRELQRLQRPGYTKF